MRTAERVRLFQRELRNAGYTQINEPVDTSAISKEDRIKYCESIAKKDYFNVVYLEAESNWRSIASELARENTPPRMIITRHGEAHHTFTTVRDRGTHNARPRHVVLETGPGYKMVREFIRAIKAKSDDDHVVVDGRVQKAFDKFSVYKQAIDEFGENLDAIIKKTRDAVEEATRGNKQYEARAEKMLDMCRGVISDRMNMDDIKSMIMQHILTHKMFALVYGLDDFQATNAVSRSLEEIIAALDMSESESRINYSTMELIAQSLTETSQKQDFLKKIYETFYKKYDPAKAEKDGIVYTPSEAVRFMVRSADELLQKHFGRTMSDDGVTILDPATGTGAFVAQILRHILPNRLKSKYADLYANEISVLPYYIAALNIEHTYKEIMGEYREFENICWMDTLDSGVKDYENIASWFGDDNVKRISRQQNSSILLAIGNPPYNAIQTSLNNANPADKYDHLDEKIRNDYYKEIKILNKNKSFDMYKRFLKWSSDRIKKNGMVVFISNNSFLDAKADGGVRRALYKEFDHIYVVNLKGNAHLAGDAWRREGGKLFGSKAKVGICISFFVKTGENHSGILYVEVEDYKGRDEKLKWLDKNTLLSLNLKTIVPDKNSVWLNQTDNNFEDLVPVLPRTHQESIFAISTPGVTVAKDDWAYDPDGANLEIKMKYYISAYNTMLQKYKKMRAKPKNLIGWVDKKIKWSRTTLNGLKRCKQITYSDAGIKPTLYRPFVIRHQYYADVITEMPRQFDRFFQNAKQNLLIVFPNPKTNVLFNVIATNLMTDFGCIDGAQNIPIWQYSSNGMKTSNVTEYGKTLFRNHYENKRIRGDDIFYYVYAIFNDPKYEETYRHNLRRGFPRIPLAKNFAEWSRIGKKLFKLHNNFNGSEEYDLKRIDKKRRINKTRLSLKTDEKGTRIVIDDVTTLENVPPEVLQWHLKSRTPIEWVLEFYKEPKNQIKPASSNDRKIREKFSTYRFETRKEEVITLLKRITTVCVETVRLRCELKNMGWGPQPSHKFTLLKNSNSSASKLRLARQQMLSPGKMQTTFVD